eukprot:4589603-Amphidinium_carterae.1
MRRAQHRYPQKFSTGNRQNWRRAFCSMVSLVVAHPVEVFKIDLGTPGAAPYPFSKTQTQTAH